MNILDRIHAVTVGKKLKAARETLLPALTQEELAERLSPVTVAMVRNWETDRTEMPRPQAMRVAEIYDMDWRWFYDGKETLPKQNEANAVVDNSESARALIEGFSNTVAVRSFIGVLAGLDNEETYFQEEEIPYEIPRAFLVGGTANLDKHAILRASGPSLKPRVRSGSRVLTYDDGILYRNTVVAAQDPAGRWWIKVLREGSDSWELHSLNSQGATFTDLNGWRVAGHAVAIFHEPDEPGPNIEWIQGRPLKA